MLVNPECSEILLNQKQKTMDKNLQKDLLKVLGKHGLKADDVKSDESKDEEKETKSVPAEDQSTVVANLAESIAKKLSKMVGEKKDLSDRDTNSLEKDVKSKIFTNWGGLKEV